MNSKSQRVAAFLLALLFLLTTVGAAIYVVLQLRSEDAGLVFDETNQSTSAADQQATEETNQETTVGTTIDNFSGPVSVPTLRFDDITPGTGDAVQAGDTVTIHYTGALASDGTVFDSSVDSGQPATFPLGNLIQGWQEGIPGMKVGGKRRLYIPAALGYGASGSGSSIPPNSDLIFDIELFDTTRGQ